MDIYVYNQSFEVLNVVDNYTSLLWVQRYSECGDFELIVPASNDYISLFSANNYLHIDKFPKSWMIVEGVKLSTDAENGDFITVTGRSLESILDRRIIFPQTVISGDLQNGIRTLIESNIGINASSNRAISNFIMESSTDETITSIGNVKAQFTGSVLYNSIIDLCNAYGIGFYVTIESNNFVFKLYNGANRSVEQSSIPPVIFSQDYDSLLESTYQNNFSTFKNVAYVNGVGEGIDRKHAIYDPIESAGLFRRELYVDARDISNQDEYGEIPDEEYTDLLISRGVERIISSLPEDSFEAVTIPDYQYKFNEDYFLGDIVTVKNSYNITSSSRITEIIFSDDETGVSFYPTFTLMN